MRLPFSIDGEVYVLDDDMVINPEDTGMYGMSAYLIGGENKTPITIVIAGSRSEAWDFAADEGRLLDYVLESPCCREDLRDCPHDHYGEDYTAYDTAYLWIKEIPMPKFSFVGLLALGSR